MTHSQTIWCVHEVLGWVDGRMNCMKDSLAGWQVARVARSLAANGANGAVVGRSHAFEQRTVINPETRLETIPLRLPDPFARVELMWFHSSPAWLLLLVLGTIIYSSDGFNPLFLFDNRLIETEYGQKAELSLNSKEERLRLHLRHPIPIYGRLVEEITVFRNGLIALDDSSAENVPRNYPADTVHTGERLQELDGRYFSVFSTVNDGLKGSVTVREIDQSENLSLGCVNTKQIERFLLIIRKSYPLDEGFQWKSIFSVTWANVTNSAQSMDKVNSYTVIIFTDGVHSYSFIQYWDINWPEKGVISSGALPPEAGIFMRPLGGYQLPRSNHSVDVELWSDESNVASPGEWLVPLSELPITSDEIVRSLPEMYTQFLESLENACGFGPHLGPEEVSATDFTNSEILTEVMNDSPKDKQLHESTEPAGWYSEDYSDEDDDSLYASELPAPTISTEQQTEITDEVHGSTDALIASETEIVYEPSTQLPQGVYDEDESRFYKTESTIIPKTVLPLDETQLPGIHSQPNEYPANYPERSDYYTSTYSQSVERCDASVECADPHSECHRFAGVSCCICREGYYGSGKSHCWREDTDHKFAFNGSLNTHLESAGRPLTLTAYVDVQHGAVGRSSSGVRGGHPNDPVYQTIRILTPMFHILNSLISSSCPNNTGGQANDVPEYSLFTLSGGLRSTLVLQFFFDIEHVGRLTATCRFRLDVDSNSVYSRGSIQIDVTKSETIALISRPYREAQGVTGEGNKSYYAKYYIDQYGRIVFPGESVRFVAEQRATDELEAAKDELMVHWTGVADVQHESTDDYSSSCLLQSGSPIPRTHSFYIRLKDRGYCSEDCSAQDGSCNLFCVDEPLLFSHEPNSCDCVHCEHAGEHCVTDGATYHCTCKPGLRRMDDKSCQADTPVPDVPYIKEQCGSVQCHPHARCIQPEQGFCQCLPGYRGDGIRRCDDDPCSRCRRNEVCTGDACVPSGANLCDGVQCGRNAFCHDGACVCTAGYTGDPRVECIEERDKCVRVRCHENARCEQGVCYCESGYQGDGFNYCIPLQEDMCRGVQCHPYATCVNGKCRCIEGYEGDGKGYCAPERQDPCAKIQCHPKAYCENGRCHCSEGYYGDGYRECVTHPKDQCEGIRCHQYGYCDGGRCLCHEGYEGDGYWECKPKAADLCANVQCHPYARCESGNCKCIQGYHGDGYRECRQGDPCEGVKCHKYGICVRGECRCRNGYEGDGYWECREPVYDPCAKMQCHPYARCESGQCRCVSGYYGDGFQTCRPRRRDPCDGVRCHENGYCQEGMCYCRDGYRGDGYRDCRLVQDDPCANVRCHPMARCHNGECRCEDGYTGDGVRDCVRITRDPCDGVRCHENGYCQEGMCYCRDGYRGDGYRDCRLVQDDPCANVRCHPMARCHNGECRCEDGYTGDGVRDCVRITRDPCDGVRCHENGYCQEGMCYCRDGYRGDGYRDCRLVQDDPCANVRCHPMARCHNGECRCEDGYTGDGVRDCVRITRDPCDGVRCHENGYCQEGMCYCRDGYRGDGYRDCRLVQDDPCANVRCHPMARCHNGECRCEDGYTGDGVRNCTRPAGDLCAGVQCHRFGQCYENRCYCSHGYVGDGVNFCDPRTEDPCQGVRCADHAHCDGGRCSCDQGYEGDGHSECRLAKDKCADVQCHERAQCYDGRCRCLDGYEGDGYYECKTSVQDPCSQVQCHQYAECRGGQCHCLLGYEGDGYYDCRPVRSDPCTNVRCHAYATCQGGVCRCRYGYEGDGYYYCRPVQRKPDRSHCDNCRGIPYKELAQCIDGRCTCTPGFVEAQPGLCVECVQDNCHRYALCMPNKEYNGAYSCQCKPGFTGNGISDCHQDGPDTSPVDRTCGGGCRVRNAECNPSNGTCVCRRGYDGDGQYSCIWNCQLCLPNAVCDRENEGCTCQPGYYGDGKTYCEPIPTTPAPVKVTIAGQGQTLRLTDLDRPLELRCYVSARDDSITGQWIQPKGSQQAHISVSRLSNGTEVLLYIARPVLTDVGLYICRAGQNEAHIEVAIDETALPYDIYLTSDDGILRVRSGGQNTTTAAVWNIAENNKYGPVSLAADCNSKRLIYTSDYGNTIRWGETDGRHKASVTHRLFTSQMSRFRHLAVDPPSGNIFAWDEGLGNIVLLNPNKPDMRYTLEKITSLRHDTAIRFAGLAVHSTKGLLYWAMFADGWMPNGTIQVASMTGENEKQVIQLSGEPLALSLSPLVENSGASTGRLCWIQRSITNTFALITELYCGRLSADGRSLLMQERVRQYRASEEPSWGLIHHGNTVLWTDATRTMYFSANPSRSVRVRHVCCSNRFQSIAVLANCQSALNNACGFSNGRCRYFCLPGDQLYRTCVCPDGEPGCHKEI